MAESLTLKWGTLKGWNVETKASIAALHKYASYGMSMCTMAQRDTLEQKDALCELIDAVDCKTICLDWEGKNVSKDEAKRYVREYGH